MAKQKEKPIIGAVERIDLPEFELFNIRARVDTGAATSAIHCHHVKVFQRQEKEYISFRLLDPSHRAYQEKTFRTSKFTEKAIRSSFGNTQYRYAIKTTIMLFGKPHEITFTLADREKMQYPILLGRNALRGFLVDVSKKNQSDKSQTK